MPEKYHPHPSEQDTEPIDIEAFLRKSERNAFPYTRKDQETVKKRLSLVHTLQRTAFPVETAPFEDDAVEIAREMRQDGFSFIVPYSHADRRGPVDVMTTLLSFGEGFEDAEYVGPLALHQKKSYIDYLSRQADIPLMPIVTKATLEYFEKKKEHPSLLQKAARIFPAPSTQEQPTLRSNQGLREYMEEAGRVLAEDKGIVFVAPQGGRRPTLGEPAGRAVEMLIREAERKGTEKIAVWPLGVLLKSGDTSSGLNPFRKVSVSFNAPLEVTELRERANENGQTLDKQVFTEFAKVLPEAYVNPRQNG